MTTTELRGRTMFVIISRHAAAIEFIRQADHRFADAPVITGNASAADVAGKVVAGNLPLFLAAEAAEVVSVEFTGAPSRAGILARRHASRRSEAGGVRSPQTA